MKEPARSITKIRVDASTLRKKVRKAGRQITWSDALNQISWAYGFADYREAKALLPKTDPLKAQP